jgi:DNA-binding winged helix-turn-helix (wHTH) protein/tetratricopeptide (TPR) repeat protein
LDAHPSQAAQAGAVISFGEFRIDCGRRQLTRAGRRLRIQARPLDVLIYLAMNHERIVGRSELLEHFWRRAVNEEALTRCISTLRKILGDAREPARYIETLWGQGYRFIAPVSIVQAAASRQLTDDTAGRPPPRRWAWGMVGLVAAVALGAFMLRLSPERAPDVAIDRLAVLPMHPSAATDEWLASALTDHLTQVISGIEGVSVVTVTSPERISTQADVRELGRLLGVGTVLRSQLVRDGERFGLRAQLLATADGSVLWNFSVPPAGGLVESAQVEQLAIEVARRLWANLRIRPRPVPVNHDAYRAYLRGRYYWSQRASAGLTAALDAFDAALELEPGYVDALVGLADTWLLMPLYTAIAPADAMPRARTAARRALELDPYAAHALAVLGVIDMQYDWLWSEAEKKLRRALALNPNDATAAQWLGELYCYRKRFEECRRYLAIAAGLDPLAPVLRMLEGSPALYSGDFEGAIRAYTAAALQAPEFPFARYVLGQAYSGLGDWERAAAEYRAVLPELGLAIVGGPLAYVLARSGARDEAEAMLAELEVLAEDRYVPPSKFATAWMGLGEKEQALAWLANALALRDDRLVYLVVDHHFAELHEEPAFRGLAGEAGLLDVLQGR